MTTFSFHPVKHLTTGEGGMVTTNDDDLDRRLRLFRNHGIETDFRQREEQGTWVYDMVELGFNYRLPDVICALGIAQLHRLPAWVADGAAQIARRYDELFAGDDDDRDTGRCPTDRVASWHLYPVRVRGDDVASTPRPGRSPTSASNGIGVNVHYRPVHLHTYYRHLGHRRRRVPGRRARVRGTALAPDVAGASTTPTRTAS